MKYSEMEPMQFLQAAEDYCEQIGSLVEFLGAYELYREHCSIINSTLLALNDVCGRDCPLLF